MAALAAVAIAVAMKGVRQDEFSAIVVAMGLLVLSCCGMAGSMSMAGFRHLRPSKRITSDGTGIRIPMRRYLLVLLIGLGFVATLALVTAIGWSFGLDSTGSFLNPDDVGEARFLLACGGIALAAFGFFLAFRAPTVLTISQVGIRRYTRRWRGLSAKTVDVFLPWDDIVEFTPDEQIVGGLIEVRNPIIRIRSTTTRTKTERLAYDTDDQVTVLAHLLVAEPNTLLSLLQFLKDNPDRRDILERPDARELLCPPPLRQRFRAARSAKSSDSVKGLSGDA
ncbi:hypothetical protein [Rhodococcus sp. MTM3W5.2]|uniref:hypothetical protein n=1 Tax=Rhodococcus sp. MTM3W5.2 TaxID=1805827 RepID=UPI0011AE2834|nr:hypothetical protein [Rhodococcus sp. MTM3W5.2]